MGLGLGPKCGTNAGYRYGAEGPRHLVRGRTRTNVLGPFNLLGKNAREGLAFRGVQQLSFMLSLLDILCPLASHYLN